MKQRNKNLRTQNLISNNGWRCGTKGERTIIAITYFLNQSLPATEIFI